uniref:Peptide-methionine (S)-S-oxide reductase n=1 Tax=Strongyloides papillosus TaxID=174720 RepID=A0A0N5B5X9_STREA
MPVKVNNPFKNESNSMVPSVPNSNAPSRAEPGLSKDTWQPFYALSRAELGLFKDAKQSFFALSKRADTYLYDGVNHK